MTNHVYNEAFALELAEALQDTDSIPFYRRCVESYDEDVLRKILAKVLSIPQHKIKKTCGALFNSLLSGNARTHFRSRA